MASRDMLALAAEDGPVLCLDVDLAARLSTTADDLEVRVRRLWPGGAVIEGTSLPACGKDVLLVRDGREAFGEIVARAGTHCTVEFEEALDEAAILMWVRPLPEDDRPAQPPRFRRPGLRSRRPTAEEWETIRALATPVPHLVH